jgi:hypothetical protein
MCKRTSYRYIQATGHSRQTLLHSRLLYETSCLCISVCMYHTMYICTSNVVLLKREARISPPSCPLSSPRCRPRCRIYSRCCRPDVLKDLFFRIQCQRRYPLTKSRKRDCYHDESPSSPTRPFLFSYLAVSPRFILKKLAFKNAYES